MRHPATPSLVGLLLALGAVAGAQPYSVDQRTLLLDHLDAAFAPDGKHLTPPAKITPLGDWKGGRPTPGGGCVPARFGDGLRLAGLMSLDYPAPGNLDLNSGTVEFWVALDFDTAEQRQDPGLLRNQLFFTLRGPGASQVCVYSTLGWTNVAVRDKTGQLVSHGNFAGDWLQGEWHHLQLRWGRRLELWCDGKLGVARDWFGLLGPVQARPEQLRLNFGSQIQWNDVQCAFVLDEIRILGPGGDALPDYPVLTVPRLARPPRLDGVLEPGEWDAAARTTGFVGLNDPALVEDQTVVYAGWDAEALYLAYECLDPQQRPLRAALQDRDSNVYTEDAVDVILQPTPEPSPHYQFICSVLGTVYDARLDPRRQTFCDLSFNPACTFKTSSAPGRWRSPCSRWG